MGNRDSVLKKIIIYMLLVLLFIVSIGPFLWLVSTSLKSPEENIYSFPPQLIPSHPTLSNWKYVLIQIPFGTYFANSIWIAFVTVILNVILSVMAAYPLDRMEFKGEKLIFMSVLSTMMIPFQVIMIPIFVMIVRLQWKNNYLAAILPFAVTAFGIFLLRQAFSNLPRSLDEAAYMDGCTSWGVLWRILFPLLKPSIATLAIFTFVNSWSNFLWPMLVLEDKNKYTLPLGLIDLQGTFYTDWRMVASGAVLSTIPIIVFFVFTQRYFLEGATAGGIKE